MKCLNEVECNGELNTNHPVPLRTSCTTFRNAIPCRTCGRLHWIDEDFEIAQPVFNRQADRVFLEGGEMVNKDENGVEQSRWAIGT